MSDASGAISGTQPPGNSLARAAVGMGAVTAGSRLVGFVRVLILAAILGTTYLGNTFQASNTVSNVLFELVAAGALSAVLVPGFVAAFAREEHREVERTANALLGIAVLVLGVIAIVGMASSRWIAALLVSGAPASVASQQADLATFWLWFFIPQVVLYAAGAVAIAVLQAKRKFLPGSAAPIASSVVLVAALVVFRVLAGSVPGLELSFVEKLVLALGGTGAVIAFVAVPIVAVHRSGLRLRPSFRWKGSGVGHALRSSSWAVVLHAALGLLLGAALIAGNAVAGGVVAYQVAWTFFLAPYAILAQPIHTAILPELTVERDDPDQFAASMRWALAGMARLLIPVSVVLFALAVPMMKVVAFGAAGSGDRLLSSALAWLAIGLFPYGALLLTTRAFYALGNTRTPAALTLLAALLGAGFMLFTTAFVHGRAVVIALGIGQSGATLVAAIALLAVLRAQLGRDVTPFTIWPVLLVSIPAGALMLWMTWTWSFESRLMNLVVFGAIGGVFTAAYLFLMQVWKPLRLPDRHLAP